MFNLDKTGSSKLKTRDFLDGGKYEEKTLSLDKDKIVPYSNHIFKLYVGERLENMVESVKEMGVMVPVIVRRLGEEYEILSGHNRVNAAKIAGIDDIPAKILEDISDEEAELIVTETNFMQRSVGDLSYSERAFVYKRHYEAIKAFGKKEQFVNEVEKLLGSGTDDGTRGKVAKETGIDSRTVNRFIRLTELNGELLNRVDSEEIPFIAAVSLSFLKENEQSALADVLNERKRKIDVKKAAALKELSQNGGLDAAKIREVLSGKTAETEKKPAAVKISRDIFSKYFSPETSAVEIESTVDKALGYYFKAIERGEIDNSAPERAESVSGESAASGTKPYLYEEDEYDRIKAEERRENLAFLGLDDEEDMER